MSMFENFRIESLCMHQVFKREQADQEKPVVFGTKVFKIDGPARDYLAIRLVAALGERSNGVMMMIKDPPEQGGFPTVKQCFSQTDDDGFLARTKELASKLSTLQTRTNIPTCVVLIVKGKTGANDRPFIAIIKAEIHSGFAKREIGDTITLEFAKDLFLTPEQRLFKIGIYIKKDRADIVDGSPDTQHYDVFVFDSQMSATNPTGAAQYFSEGFLGCVRPQDNNVLTQKFYDATKSFIYRNKQMNEEQKHDASLSLYSYLKVRRAETFQTSEFADLYLLKKLKDPYEAYMRECGIPDRPVHKDLSLLRGTLDRKRLVFKSGLSVAGSPDAFRKNLKMAKTDTEGVFTVTITDSIDSQT